MLDSPESKIFASFNKQSAESTISEDEIKEEKEVTRHAFKELNSTQNQGT